jgi:excisionase family DNA binding protein
MASAADSRKYLSVGETAHELRVSKASVYRAIESGNLPAVQLQPLGSLRIPADALQPERHRDEDPLQRRYLGPSHRHCNRAVVTHLKEALTSQPARHSREW